MADAAVADDSAGLMACTAGADGEPTLAADESISLKQEGVLLHIDDAPASSGVLYVTTRRLVWFASSGTEGYEVPFRSIVLHAVSRDTTTSPQPCILAQVEGPAPGASAGEDDEDDEPACTQLRLVPADKASLDSIFSAMCDSAALNPDPTSEGDDEGGEFYCGEEGDGDEDEDGAREAALERFDAILQIDAGRFADDDEEDEEQEEGEEVGMNP